jgi:predicted O-methyltransferase YrrM
MNSAVALAERIKLNGATSPLDFLISLSEILAQDELDSLHIDKIEWQAINIDEKNKKIKSANFTDKVSIKHNAVVTGRIDDPENNYRASIDHIQRIVNYLKTDKRIENVETLIMPVDLRSESQFSTESGVDIKQSKNSETSGTFSFEITMRAPGHV